MEYMFAYLGLINNGIEWVIEERGQKISAEAQLLKKPENHMHESHAAGVEFTL